MEHGHRERGLEGGGAWGPWPPSAHPLSGGDAGRPSDGTGRHTEVGGGRYADEGLEGRHPPDVATGCHLGAVAMLPAVRSIVWAANGAGEEDAEDEIDEDTPERGLLVPCLVDTCLAGGSNGALYCALTIGSSTPEACETPETEKHRQARDGSSPPERSDGHSRAEPELALADDARVFRNLAAGRLEVGGKRACGWLGSGGASTAVTADPPRMISRPLASCSCSLLHSTRSTCASSALLAGGPPLLRAHGRGQAELLFFLVRVGRPVHVALLRSV